MPPSNIDFSAKRLQCASQNFGFAELVCLHALPMIERAWQRSLLTSTRGVLRPVANAAKGTSAVRLTPPLPFGLDKEC
jgi:hypothetical protein